MSGYSGSVSMTGTASAGGAEFNVQLSLTLSVSTLTDNSGQLTGNETVSGDFISTSAEGGSDSGDTSLVDNPLSITGPYPDGPFTLLSGGAIEFSVQQSSDVIYPPIYNGINDYIYYVDVTLTESYDPTSNLITGTANAVFIDGVGLDEIGSASANFQLSTVQAPPIVVSIQTGASTISSGNTTSVAFDLHLSTPASQDVTVKLIPDMSSTDPSVLNGAGAFAVDSQYLTDWSVSGGLQVTIPAGVQDQTVTVDVNGNASVDPKTAYFTLGIDPTSVPSGISVDPNHGVAVGTIQQASSDPVQAVITGDESSSYKALLNQDIQAALDRVYAVIPGEKNTTIKIQVKFTPIAPLLAAAAPILTTMDYALYSLLSPTAAIPSGSGGLAVQVPLTLINYQRGTDSSASDIYLQIDPNTIANWYNGDIDSTNQTAGNTLNHDSLDAVAILTHELLHGFDFGAPISELSGNGSTAANAWGTHVGLVGSTYYYFLPTPQAVALNNGPTDPAPEHVADPSDIMYYQYNGDHAISSSDVAILQNFGYSPFSLKVQVPVQGSTTLTVDHSFAYTDAGDANLTIVGSGQGDIIALGAGNDSVIESSGNNNISVWNQAAAGSDTVDLE
jgi:hypothetical protein